MKLADIERRMKADGEIITQVVEKWAETTPDKTFLFYGEEDQSLTYREFNELANSIAHNLKALGVEKGDRVSTLLKQPVVTTLSMFGIWKTGAIYSPINYSYMGRLLAYQINDTNPKVLITEKALLPLINEIKDDIGDIIIVLHSPKENEHDYNPEQAAVEPDPKFRKIPFADMLTGDTSNLNTPLAYHDTANLIYTSGTTGPAKGVVQTYRWMNQYTIFFRASMSPDDVVYNDLPLYHVGGAFENVVRGAWKGCTVALWDKFSPSDFWNRVRKCGATTVILLDVMIPWLLANPEQPDDRMNTLNKVYMQPMPLHHNQIAKRFGFDFVLTAYGQTEAGCPFAGVFDELDDGEEGTPPELWKGYSKDEVRAIYRDMGITLVSGKKELKKGFMGKPMFFVEANVLNDLDEECAVGESGQLCFRPHLPWTIMVEYFGKPEGTVKEWRNLWFHTGDAVYKDEDGFFYFVDRMGGFIRHKGENISSYQVEDIVNSHPAVNSCAAFPIPAKEGLEDDIVVYVVVQPDEKLEDVELREWLKGKMPKFMWPQHIRFIDELPKTPTNKLEKYKLKKAILDELAGA